MDSVIQGKANRHVINAKDLSFQVYSIAGNFRAHGRGISSIVDFGHFAENNFANCTF